MNTPSNNPDRIKEQLLCIAVGIDKNEKSWPKTGTPPAAEVRRVAEQINEFQNHISIKTKEMEELKTRLKDFVKKNARKMYKKVRDQAYSTHGRQSSSLRDYNLSVMKNSSRESDSHTRLTYEMSISKL